jgi:hypothetical protein
MWKNTSLVNVFKYLETVFLTCITCSVLSEKVAESLWSYQNEKRLAG